MQCRRYRLSRAAVMRIGISPANSGVDYDDNYIYREIGNVSSSSTRDYYVIFNVRAVELLL